MARLVVEFWSEDGHSLQVGGALLAVAQLTKGRFELVHELFRVDGRSKMRASLEIDTSLPGWTHDAVAGVIRDRMLRVLSGDLEEAGIELDRVWVAD